jgi:hypothetical protein
MVTEKVIGALFEVTLVEGDTEMVQALRERSPRLPTKLQILLMMVPTIAFPLSEPWLPSRRPARSPVSFLSLGPQPLFSATP